MGYLRELWGLLGIFTVAFIGMLTVAETAWRAAGFSAFATLGFAGLALAVWLVRGHLLCLEAVGAFLDQDHGGPVHALD